MQASKLRTIMMLASMTALPLALCTGFAEARGVGITRLAIAKETIVAGRGRMAASLAAPQTLPSQADDTIVAERTPIRVRASEAAVLLDELQLQLAAQPAARLHIHWQLTRPAEAK